MRTLPNLQRLPRPSIAIPQWGILKRWCHKDPESFEERAIIELTNSNSDNITDEDNDYNSEEADNDDFIDDDNDDSDDNSTDINEFYIKIKIDSTYSPKSRALCEWDPEYWQELWIWDKRWMLSLSIWIFVKATCLTDTWCVLGVSLVCGEHVFDTCQHVQNMWRRLMITHLGNSWF